MVGAGTVDLAFLPHCGKRDIRSRIFSRCEPSFSVSGGPFVVLEPDPNYESTRCEIRLATKVKVMGRGPRSGGPRRDRRCRLFTGISNRLVIESNRNGSARDSLRIGSGVVPRETKPRPIADCDRVAVAGFCAGADAARRCRWMGRTQCRERVNVVGKGLRSAAFVITAR